MIGIEGTRGFPVVLTMNILPILTLLILSAVATADLEVPLTVRDHAGVTHRGVVVRGGVPFAIGVLKECKSPRLMDAAGKSIPCRARPTARWYDGSIKWLLVDALVDVPANGQVDLRFRPGEVGPAKGPRVTVTEKPDSILIDTGSARFLFSRKTFGLPSAAWVDVNGDGTADTKVVSDAGEFACEVEHQPPGPPEEENWLRDAAGGPRERFVASASGDYTATVENANDLHAVVKLSGWLVNPAGRRLIQYVIRAHAYAGTPELRIVQTFVYAGNPKQNFLRSMSLRFPLKSAGSVSYALGGVQRHAGQLAGSESVSLFETGPKKIYHLAPHALDKDVYYSVTQSGREIAKGKEAAGWARVSDQSASMHVAVRNFWQMHPKELKVDAQGITVFLWPEQGGKVLDLRRRSDEVENVYHYDLSLWPYGGEGVGVTHEMLLRFGPAREDAGPAMAAALNAPLLLQCSPEQYAASGAFGPMAAADPQRFPHLEGVLDVDLEWIRHNQRSFHWDGMIDYGDTLFHGYATPSHYGYIAPDGWCSRGYVGWLCNDGTLTHSLFLHYLRTGDYETFRTAEAMARHVMDVDTCHYCAEEPGCVGGGHRHDQQHWGNGVRGYGTTTHGAIDYYLLTGDERALEVAGEYANYHDNGTPTENEDRIGGLIRYWDITGDARWKKKADELVAAELNVPAGKGWRFVTDPHFRFVSNTSVSLLYYLYSAPPGDTVALREAILKSADYRESGIMNAWDDVGYFPTILTSLACQQTGDRRYALMTAALMQRLRLPMTLKVPADYQTALRDLDFEGMLAAARQWGVNNVYTAAIHQLCSIPYAIAALQKAGMDEKAAVAVKLESTAPPPFEEVLDPKNIGHEKGFCYIAGMTHVSPSDIGGGHSDLLLFEDGKPLGPAHSAHQEIRDKGTGRYSHWGTRSVYFSASDNSDPKTNRRTYKVVYPGPKR